MQRLFRAQFVRTRQGQREKESTATLTVFRGGLVRMCEIRDCAWKAFGGFARCALQREREREGDAGFCFVIVCLVGWLAVFGEEGKVSVLRLFGRASRS